MNTLNSIFINFYISPYNLCMIGSFYFDLDIWQHFLQLLIFRLCSSYSLS